MTHGGSRILVPVANPQTQPVLFSISEALCDRGGELVVLNVVEAREQMDFSSAMGDAGSRFNCSISPSHCPTGSREDQAGCPGVAEPAARASFTPPRRRAAT